MHAEAWGYFVRMRSIIGKVDGLRILEFGSHDVNGSPRSLFNGCRDYIGVDPWDGPGVDVVSTAQEYDGQAAFDVVISAETLEHDPDPIGLQGLDQIGLIDGGAPAQIDKAGRLFHQSEKRFVNQASGRLRIGQQVDDKVALFEYLAHLSGAINTIDPFERSGIVFSADDTHAQHGHPAGDFLPDAAQTDNARCAPMYLVLNNRAVPFTLELVSEHQMKIAGQVDHRGDGIFGHVNSMDAAAAGKHNSLFFDFI